MKTNNPNSHPGQYVSAQWPGTKVPRVFVRHWGADGRTYTCIAVDRDKAMEKIREVKDGS